MIFVKIDKVLNWLNIANFSKTEFLIIGLKKQLSTIDISSLDILHATLVSFAMNVLPSLIRSYHFQSPAVLISVNSAVSVLTLILKTASTIAVSIVHSKVDYCTSVILQSA